jgi:hypothetical protein
MSLTLIRTQIKTKLEAISGVENVYDYKRFCSDLATYKDLFIKDAKVNTWEIERKAFSRTGRGGSGDIEDVIHEFIIRGFYSFYDAYATEKTFQDLVETICADFISDPTLGGKAKMMHVPITGEFSNVMLGNVLCHQVQINITIEDRII